jgi:hypothetical protein
MSTPDTGDARENREGDYTETNDESPHERTVHGQYTETEDAAPADEVEGSYTNADEPVDAPGGDYTEKDAP